MSVLHIPTGPSDLTVNVTKNNEILSSVIQWDAVDGSLATNYTVTWTSETDPTQSVATTVETLYTITGLILDTVYTITVTGANMCGSGPEFTTSISFPTGTISITIPNIIPTVIVGILLLRMPYSKKFWRAFCQKICMMKHVIIKFVSWNVCVKRGKKCLCEKS